MSSPNPEMTARHHRVLAELAEITLAAARDLGERLQAAEGAGEARDLALGLHRIAHSVRQTVLLEAKLERGLAPPAQDRAAGGDEKPARAPDAARKARVRAEVVREITEQAEDMDAAEELIEDLDLVFDTLVDGHDFAGRGEEALVVDLCRAVRVTRSRAPAEAGAPADAPTAPPIISVNGWPPEPDSS